jgi:hypothetical protein
MRFVVITSLMLITIIFGGAAWAGKKTPTNKEKIIGAWKLTKTTALVFDEYFAYELDGDRLRLCQAAAGQFPKEFKTKGISGSRIEEFKRVKKGQ